MFYCAPSDPILHRFTQHFQIILRIAPCRILGLDEELPCDGSTLFNYLLAATRHSTNIALVESEGNFVCWAVFDDPQ